MCVLWVLDLSLFLLRRGGVDRDEERLRPAEFVFAERLNCVENRLCASSVTPCPEPNSYFS